MFLRSTIALFFGLTTLAHAASALEFSMVSGLYRSESSKTDGVKAGGSSTVNLGTRVAGPIDQQIHWFGEGDLTLRSYSGGANTPAPDNTTSLMLGGGVRYYFSRFAEFAVPFAYGFGRIRNEKEGATTVNETTTTETSGLFYGAAVGVRFGLDKDFFLDLEAPLFESPLFATTTTEKTTATGTTKTSTSSTDIYVNTTGALNSMKIALGLKI